MLLTFLRHAEAEDAVTSDFDRRLTAKGLGQADKVGEFCVRTGLAPDVIVTSPVVRAEQTARAVSKRLDDCEVIVERWLECGMSPEDCFAGLAGYAKFAHVMLVGHEPDFSGAIGACLGLADSGRMVVRKASLTTISLPRLRSGAGRLESTLPVRLM